MSTKESMREVLLSILQSREGEWLNRADLAQALNRRQMLNHNDLFCLNALAREGLIEVQERPRNKYAHYTWFYRARPDK